MRVALLGYQTWGRRSLEALLERREITVSLVVTHPDGDDLYERVWTDSIDEPARDAGVPLVELRGRRRRRARGPRRDGRRRRRRRVELASPTCPSRRSQLVPLAGVNVHDALLPRYGGFAPLNWAIARGEADVGVSAHVMSPAIDLGDLIVQERLPVGPDETAREVAERVFARVGPVTVAALDRIADPGFAPRPQARERATLFHRRALADSRIDWTRPAREVHDLVRAQADPYPNAFAFHDGRRLAVKRAALPARAYCGTPGRVASRNGEGVVVICGRDPADPDRNQGLVLHEVQPEGADAVDAATYFDTPGGDLT